MKKNKISYTDAFKMYTSIGMCKSFFDYILGYIIVTLGIGLWIKIRGTDLEDFPFYAMIPCIGCTIYTFLSKTVNSPFDVASGGKFFLSVRDRYDIYKKFQISSLFITISVYIVSFLISVFMVKVVFRFLDKGIGIFITVLIGLILQRGLINFALLIKSVTTRSILGGVFSSFSMCFIIPFLILQEEISADTYMKILLIAGIIAVITIVVSEILVLKVYKKKFSLK